MVGEERIVFGGYARGGRNGCDGASMRLNGGGSGGLGFGLRASHSFKGFVSLADSPQPLSSSVEVQKWLDSDSDDDEQQQQQQQKKIKKQQRVYRCTRERLENFALQKNGYGGFLGGGDASEFVLLLQLILVLLRYSFNIKQQF